LTYAAGLSGEFVPWDSLIDNSWLEVAPPDVLMHTVNAGSYELGFDIFRTDGGARGMNALKFAVGLENTGHHTTSSLSGSFDVENTGGTHIFDDLLLLVVVDANSLDSDFSFSIAQDCNGIDCNDLYYFDNNLDFSYYDPDLLGYDTGRPSGYYFMTSPSSEPVSYLFDSGMVTLFAFENVYLKPRSYANNRVTINYHFCNLHSTAVFSVYGYDSLCDGIYHTNRAIPDNNDPVADVSTFAVVPQPSWADFDEDWDVDLADFAQFVSYWLDSPCKDPNEPCHRVDVNEDNIVNMGDFAEFSRHYLDNSCP